MKLERIKRAILISCALSMAACHQTIIPNLPFLPEPEEPPAQDTVIDTTNAPATSRAERIKWIQSNAYRLLSYQPSAEDFSDLAPLRQHIGDSRIVVLGEQSQQDARTQLAKTRLVKFLQQVMGFEILAFESGIYDTWKAWLDIEAGYDVVSSFRAAIDPLWGRGPGMGGFFDYLDQNANSAKPLTLVGIDCEFSGVYSEEMIGPDLQDYLTSVGIQTDNYPDWGTFLILLDKLANATYNDANPDGGQKSVFSEVLDRLSIEIDHHTIPSDPQAMVWRQIIESIDVEAKRMWNEWGLAGRVKPPQYWNLKSDQMANNLLTFSNVVFPDKKIIVWAHSRHVCRRMDEEITNQDGWTSTTGMTSMVDVLWDQLGTDVYALNFTAYQSETATDDFEDLMRASGQNLAFIDLRSLYEFRTPETNRMLPANGAWFRQGLVMRPMYYIRMKARDWTNTIDGVIYIY